MSSGADCLNGWTMSLCRSCIGFSSMSTVMLSRIKSQVRGTPLAFFFSLSHLYSFFGHTPVLKISPSIGAAYIETCFSYFMPRLSSPTTYSCIETLAYHCRREPSKLQQACNPAARCRMHRDLLLNYLHY